jgi:hypothetical protein
MPFFIPGLIENSFWKKPHPIIQLQCMKLLKQTPIHNMADMILCNTDQSHVRFIEKWKSTLNDLYIKSKVFLFE